MSWGLLSQIKQQLSLELLALLLALSWVLVRLLSLVVRKLQSDGKVSLIVNGKEVASLAVEVQPVAAGTAKAERQASDGFTKPKTGDLISYSQAEKPASSATRPQKRQEGEKEGSIK